MPTAERRVAHRQRVSEALRLWQEGCDARAISDRLGCTVIRASKLVAEAFASMPAATVDDLRLGVETRLDRLARVYGAALDDPDARTRLAAANGLLMVERDRTRLLGLAHPAQRAPKEDT